MNEGRVLAYVKFGFLSGYVQELEEYFLVALLQFVSGFSQDEAAVELFVGMVHFDYAIVTLSLFVGREDVFAGNTLYCSQVAEVGVPLVSLQNQIPALESHFSYIYWLQ